MSTSMSDSSGLRQVDKRSLAALPAIRDFERGCGFSIDVFPDEQWEIVIVDGRPAVVLNRAGVYTLALLSPNQATGQAMARDFTAYLSRRDAERGRS